MHLAFIALGVLLAACGSSDPASVDASRPPVDAAVAAPSLWVEATPATIAHGDSVTIAVTTENYDIVDPRPGPPVMPGEGHYHFYIDDEPDYTAGWTPSVTLTTSAADTLGVHTVRFVLVTSVHVEITPLVEATATFTIQ